MANILFVYDSRITATIGMLTHLLDDVKARGYKLSDKYVHLRKITNSDITWCDNLCMVRPRHKMFKKLARIAHDHGKRVFLFLDDDLLNMPAEITYPWQKDYLNKDLFIEMARMSDIIISSSPRICSRYSKDFGIPRSVQIDYPVKDEYIKQHLDNDGRIKIVYAAGLPHAILFNMYVTPILKELDERFGDRISLTFFGVKPELDVSKYSIPIEYIDHLPLDKYRKRMEEEHFDIGLAPLVSMDFTKCKYYNKFIEYAMFGIVGVYSNTEPYTYVIEDGENGLLVDDDPRLWLDAICKLIENRGLMEHCREESYKMLREKFSPDVVIDRLLHDIPELLDEPTYNAVTGVDIYKYKCMYYLDTGIAACNRKKYELAFALKHAMKLAKNPKKEEENNAGI